VNRKTWIGIVFVLAPVSEDLLAQTLYKHVDENGKITYSDHPQQGGDAVENAGSPNVAAPQARQQMYIEQCRDRQDKREPRERETLRGHERREADQAAIANCVNRRENRAIDTLR
jgi:uncharacterized protein DUF4124